MRKEKKLWNQKGEEVPGRLELEVLVRVCVHEYICVCAIRYKCTCMYVFAESSAKLRNTLDPPWSACPGSRCRVISKCKSVLRVLQKFS